jgi:hypothetical protein
MVETNPLLDLADLADELTRPMHHSEPLAMPDRHRNRRVRHVWRTEHPSLLDQLAAAVMPGEAYAEDAGGAKAKRPFPPPPARLDAVDRLLAIEAAVAHWCMVLGLPLRETAAENLRALVGASGTISHEQLLTLVADAKAWRNWAATVTGWQEPPWSPGAACPMCGKLAGLRVRLDRKTACCVHCGESWDGETIGLLARHISTWKAAVAAEAAAARARERARRAEQTA